MNNNLCEDESFWAPTVQTQDESDGLEELVDAGPELFLLHPAGGPRVQDPRLYDELKQVLQRLENTVKTVRLKTSITVLQPGHYKHVLHFMSPLYTHF